MDGTDDPDDETKERARPEVPETQPAAQPPAPPLWAAPQNAQQPPPPGPQSPQPGPQSPVGAPQAPPAPPGYGGPVPPGGWHQPQPTAFTPPGELASWGSRVGATLLDGLILTVSLVVVIAVIAGLAAVNETVALVIGIPLGIAAFAGWFVYAPYFMRREGARNGQSLGKQIVGIRVVRDNGVPMTFGPAFLREFVVKTLLFGTVGGAFFLSLPLLLDYLWPLWDDQDRALHDMIVTTHVVRP